MLPLVLFFGYPLELAPQAPRGRYVLHPAGSRIWFEARANVGAFQGEAT
jgi:hypothetical protein